MIIMIYSGIFSAQKDNHPVPSIYTIVTGKESPSQGMSRAFSEIVRLRFQSALNYNRYSLHLFSFFFLQLLLRIGISTGLHFYHADPGKVVRWDIPLTILLFLGGFYPFLAIWKYF